MNSDLENLPNLVVGSKAPNFSLSNQSGELIELDTVLKSGKRVLLVFYPGDMTPGCTAQLCGIRDIYKDYVNAGVKVFGVNHKDSQSHKKFIDLNGYQFDILVDTDRKVQKEYGAVKKFFNNTTTKRGVFLIDTDGKILYRFWGQQDNQLILNLIDSLK
jgi:thioredoxin-dependent peroxiredoxin